MASTDTQKETQLNMINDPRFKLGICNRRNQCFKVAYTG